MPPFLHSFDFYIDFDPVESDLEYIQNLDLLVPELEDALMDEAPLMIGNRPFDPLPDPDLENVRLIVSQLRQLRGRPYNPGPVPPVPDARPIIRQILEEGNGSPIQMTMPIDMDVPQGEDQELKNYISKLSTKYVEEAKAIPVPASFIQVLTTEDSDMDSEYVHLTPNKGSEIFSALASYMFHSTDPNIISQAKVMFLNELENDYHKAKSSDNYAEMSKCLRLLDKLVQEFDEPWTEDEWLIASKTFFAPIHVLYRCKRIPQLPHCTRYIFSSVVENEDPIRIILENGEFADDIKADDFGDTDDDDDYDSDLSDSGVDSEGIYFF